MFEIGLFYSIGVCCDGPLTVYGLTLRILTIFRTGPDLDHFWPKPDQNRITSLKKVDRIGRIFKL